MVADTMEPSLKILYINAKLIKNLLKNNKNELT